MAAKTWLITGISRGIGKALAQAALARGDTVIGTTRGGAPDIGAPGGTLHVLPLDVTDEGAVQGTVERAFGIAGRIDVLVNNAGYGLLGPVEAASAAEARHLFDVNLFGPLAVIRAALPALRRQRHGHIVNISSIAGLAPAAGSGLYAASKAALEALSVALWQEAGPLGIRVTVVSPGSFRTDFLSDHSLRRAGTDIPDYVGSAGQVVGGLLSRAGRQPGDPDRAAQAILRAVDSPDPPIDLLLGADALERARSRLDRLGADMADWAPVARDTAFPAGH